MINRIKQAVTGETEAKYQEALDALEALLLAFGTQTPIWDAPRRIIERERPIVKAGK